MRPKKKKSLKTDQKASHRNAPPADLKPDSRIHPVERPSSLSHSTHGRSVTPAAGNSTPSNAASDHFHDPGEESSSSSTSIGSNGKPLYKQSFLYSAKRRKDFHTNRLNAVRDTSELFKQLGLDKPAFPPPPKKSPVKRKRPEKGLAPSRKSTRTNRQMVAGAAENKDDDDDVGAETSEDTHDGAGDGQQALLAEAGTDAEIANGDGGEFEVENDADGNCDGEVEPGNLELESAKNPRDEEIEMGSSHIVPNESWLTDAVAALQSVSSKQGWKALVQEFARVEHSNVVEPAKVIIMPIQFCILTRMADSSYRRTRCTQRVAEARRSEQYSFRVGSFGAGRRVEAVVVLTPAFVKEAVKKFENSPYLAASTSRRTGNGRLVGDP
jgi:hypothetical protein